MKQSLGCLGCVLFIFLCSCMNEPQDHQDYKGSVQDFTVWEQGLKPHFKSIQFKSPVGSVRSVGRFFIKGRAETIGDGFVGHFYFNGFDFFDGLKIHLERVDGGWKVFMHGPGEAKELRESHFLKSSSERQEFIIEIDNRGYGHGYVRIWQRYQSNGTLAPSERRYFSAASAEIDSADFSIPWLLSGRGVFWGIELKGFILEGASHKMGWINE